MKKYLFMLAAALCLTACNSDDQFMVPPLTDNDFEGPNGEVIVQLGGVNPYAKANTRAPLTELTEDNVTFGIYALATSEDGVPTTNSTAWADMNNSGILLNNVKGAISNWAAGAEKGVVATDVQKISLYDAAGETKGKVYYYPMQKKYEYTFFGYAPYQAENGRVSATNTFVTFPEFQGYEDIIWQKAEAAPVAKNQIYVTKDNGGNPVLGGEGNIYGYKAQYIRMLKYHYELDDYQNTAEGVAEHPWIPNLNFQHKLAQLRFSIIAAKDQSKEDKKEAQKIKVTDIKILNHGRTPKLNILNGSLAFEGNKDLSMLQVTEGTTYTDYSASAIEYTPQYDATNEQDIENPVVDGYMMVQSTEDRATDYELQLTLIAPTDGDATAEPETQTVTIKLDPPAPKEESGKTANEFYPGMYYNIRIGIYAMQEVKVTATLEEWEAGSDNDIYAPVE